MITVTKRMDVDIIWEANLFKTSLMGS